MSHETESLIEDLCNEEKPVAAEPCDPFRMLVLGLGSVAIYIGLFMLLMGTRDDLVEKLRYMPYQFEVLFGALTIVSAILAASWQAFPDLSERSIMGWFPFLPFLAFLTSFGLGFALHSSQELDLAYCIECALHMCMIALLPTAALYYVLAQGVFIHAARASLHVGLAASMTSYLSARLVEKNDDMTHMLLGHILPIFGLMLVFALVHRWLIRKHTV